MEIVPGVILSQEPETKNTEKEKIMRIRNCYLVVFLLMGFLVFGCTGGCSGGGSNGGGGTSNPGLTQRTLSWTPPTQYTDGTSIDNIVADLKQYRIFVRQDTSFSPSDPYVTVSVVNPTTGQLMTEYDLRNAAPALGLTVGKSYYVAMKTVSTAGVESDFSAPSPAFQF